jgi:hypothetical protein
LFFNLLRYYSLEIACKHIKQQQQPSTAQQQQDHKLNQSGMSINQMAPPQQIQNQQVYVNNPYKQQQMHQQGQV